MSYCARFEVDEVTATFLISKLSIRCKLKVDEKAMKDNNKLHTILNCVKIIANNKMFMIAINFVLKAKWKTATKLR